MHKENNAMILEYYQELGQFMLSSQKQAQAIDCFKKALKISTQLHGEDHFVTFECLLNLA